MPHPSFDIDGDGIVSIQDYNLAKKFDADGNGIIDNVIYSLSPDASA